MPPPNMTVEMELGLKIAASRGGGERQMPRPLFDRAFRASLIHTLKAV
jgi:hypothetical protein